MAGVPDCFSAKRSEQPAMKALSIRQNMAAGLKEVIKSGFPLLKIPKIFLLVIVCLHVVSMEAIDRLVGF
jgi:hypothetical protein